MFGVPRLAPVRPFESVPGMRQNLLASMFLGLFGLSHLPLIPADTSKAEVNPLVCFVTSKKMDITSLSFPSIEGIDLLLFFIVNNVF